MGALRSRLPDLRSWIWDCLPWDRWPSNEGRGLRVSELGLWSMDQRAVRQGPRIVDEARIVAVRFLFRIRNDMLGIWPRLMSDQLQTTSVTAPTAYPRLRQEFEGRHL